MTEEATTRAQPWPRATTRPVMLLGWPARYSMSPVVHNAAFAAHDLDLTYLVAPTRSEDLGTVVEAFGAIGVVGASVTVPHKVAVMDFCDELTEEVRLVGAVNTLVWRDSGLIGHNTDSVGFLHDLSHTTGVTERDCCTLFGTGGAARAVAVAVGRLGAKLHVVGRRPDAVEELTALAIAAGAPEAQAVGVGSDSEVAKSLADSRIVINATPLGMNGESLPDAFHRLSPDQVAYDLIYQPTETPFLRSALDAGAGAHSGIGMLVGQAAASYEEWTNRPAPIDVMREAAERALSVPPPRS